MLWSLQAPQSKWRTHSIWKGRCRHCLPAAVPWQPLVEDEFLCIVHQHCCQCFKHSMSGCSVPGAWESMAGPAKGQGVGAKASPAPGAAQNGMPVPQQPQPAAIQMV